MGPERHRIDIIACTRSITRSLEQAIVPRVDKISTIPRGYCRNRLARPNSQVCTRITLQPEVSVLEPMSMRSRTVL